MTENTMMTDRLDEVIVYSSGLCFCAVCAPADMSIDELTQLVNIQNPTGISSRWQLSDTDVFASGESMPAPCAQDDSKLHYLFEC